MKALNSKWEYDIPPNEELDTEEELGKLTYADMEAAGMRSSPDLYDGGTEEELGKLTYADMEAAGMRSSPDLYDGGAEEELGKLTYADMEAESKHPSSDLNGEERIADLAYTEMDRLQQKEIGENSLKATHDEAKPPDNIQVSNNQGRARPNNLHSPNLLLSREIIKKHRFKRMSKDETALSRSNGRSYEPLTREELEAIVYEEIPFEVKLNLDSCASMKRNVIEYIYDEMALMVKEGHREYYFESSDYERIKGRVVLQNGVYNIAEDVLEEFDTDSPYYYELNATYLECADEWLETSTFDKVISDACEGDKESIKTILQGLGALLIPDKIKKISVLGPASNSGKSVIVRFLEKIFPRGRILHISPTALKGRFALGNAENAVLISCMDVDMEDISPAAAGCIKRATGEDVILTEKKHQNAKDIYVRFKFVFGTNGGFCTSQYDAGWLNRLFVLPFTHELADEEIDMRVPEKLEAEKDAIVTKLLRAMRETLVLDGNIKLYESPASKALKLKWISRNNYFEDFFRQVVELTGDDLDNYSSEEVYEAYSQFYICQVKQDKECRNRHKLTKVEFISNLSKCGGGLIERKRVGRSRKEHFANAQHRICGLVLKSPDISDSVDRQGREI